MVVYDVNSYVTGFRKTPGAGFILCHYYVIIRFIFVPYVFCFSRNSLLYATASDIPISQSLKYSQPSNIYYMYLCLQKIDWKRH